MHYLNAVGLQVLVLLTDKSWTKEVLPTA